MIQRAIIAGLTSTGVHVADLRISPARRDASRAEDAGPAGRASTSAARAPDPEVIQVRVFEWPGNQMTSGLQKEVEKHFSRQELRRATFAEVGETTYPARVRESYAQDILDVLDMDVDPTAPVPDRRRLRPLAGRVHAAARPRPARRRGDRRPRRRSPTTIAGELEPLDARAHRHRRAGRPRLRDRPGSRAPAARRRARRARAGRPRRCCSSSACSCSPGARARSPCRSPHDRSRRRARRAAPPSRSSARRPRWASSRARRRRTASCSRARRRAASSSRTSCPATTP